MLVLCPFFIFRVISKLLMQVNVLRAILDETSKYFNELWLQSRYVSAVLDETFMLANKLMLQSR